MMRHWNRRLYVFCFNVDDISMIFYYQYQNSGAIKRRVTEKFISGEEIWDCYISTNVFWNTEWTRTLSIWSLIHYFFWLQQSWHTHDHQIKKKQPGRMRIDILASILFFEVIWISTHDPNFRVIHFFLCFFLRNLVACRIDLETAGWDSPMKNWSLGVENMICHVECSYSTKISSSSFFLM